MSNDITAIVRDYRSATQFFIDCVAQVTAENIDVKHPDEWSARQVIHHMADSEAQSYARIRRLLTEPEGSIIQGYDEAAWATCTTLGYADLPYENSLAVFIAVRAASADVLARMTESDLDRMGVHSESGLFGVRNWISSYTNHPRDHGNQLLRALRAEA